jgi:hypothetical protein
MKAFVSIERRGFQNVQMVFVAASLFFFFGISQKKQSVSSGAELCPVQICSQPEPEKVEASSQSAKISSVEASLKPAM